MPNPIDICTTTDVKLHLNYPLVAKNSPGLVDTTVASSVTAGTRTVTPAAMDAIQVGRLLAVDVGTSMELVIVSAVTDTTFTAYFAYSHTGPFQVQDSDSLVDVVLGNLITGASAYVLTRTGNVTDDGTVPAKNPFVEPVTYDEWYDGSGSNRLFLRHWPIRSITSLEINGKAQTASSSFTQSGYVIEDTKKSIAFRGASVNVGRTSWVTVSGKSFAYGIQNVHVVYSAGYSATPADLKQACVELIAFNFRRRDWMGMKTVTQPQGEGTVTYAVEWVVPPSVEDVLVRYTRKSY